jgi:hypothetical protein
LGECVLAARYRTFNDPFHCGGKPACQLVRHESATRNFWSDEEVARTYYPEMEDLIAAATGARWAFVFDHTVRRRIFGLADRTPGAPRQPPMHVHVDYTESSAPRRLREVMGQAATSLLRRRLAVISAWRPIRGPLYDAPLALCDASSVRGHRPGRHGFRLSRPHRRVICRQS